ncbi:MAG: hypothetical protein M4579_003078 [Chaenotheca gracillima]|nr:MAG: hypothetical protein M4579_003078 [Chaenotheca gracillima]
MESEHRALASCLHFILSGKEAIDRFVSPVANLQRLKSGKGVIDPAANLLHDIIDAGWVGRNPGRTLAEVEQAVQSIIGSGRDSGGVVPDEGNHGSSPAYLKDIKEECRDWATTITANPQ